MGPSSTMSRGETEQTTADGGNAADDIGAVDDAGIVHEDQILQTSYFADFKNLFASRTVGGCRIVVSTSACGADNLGSIPSNHIILFVFFCLVVVVS